MKRFRIVMMVPCVKEVEVADVQAAHNSATKFAEAQALGDLDASVYSIEFIEDVQPELVDFGTEAVDGAE